MSITDLLIWENIHQWAENTDSTQDIGIANSCSLCPIARYLGATTGNFRWSIMPALSLRQDTVVLFAIENQTGETTPLPEWLQRVVEQVDNTIGHSSISKQVFLSILEDCKPS